MYFISETQPNTRLINVFFFFVCAYFTSLCLFPSKAEAVGVLALALAIMQVRNNDRMDFFKDLALYALLTFGAYSSAVNAFGPGEVARTGIIYGWAVPFLVGKAFARFNPTNLLTHIFFAAVALACFMLFAQVLYILGVSQIGDINFEMSSLTLSFRNSSRTAIFVATGAMLCLTYAFHNRSKRTSFLAICSCVTLISALVGTGSRMTLAAFLLCSSAFLILQKKLRVLFFVLTIILLFVPFFGKEQRFNLNPSHLISTQSATERFTVWYAAWEIFKENPIMGSGFRTFKEAASPHVADYRKFHPQINNYETLGDAHNIVLHLLSESGLIGISIFTAIFFYGVRNSWYLRINANAAIPLILCITLIFLHAQLHVNIFSTNVSGLLFLLTGMSSGLQVKGEHNS